MGIGMVLIKGEFPQLKGNFLNEIKIALIFAITNLRIVSDIPYIVN